MCLLGLLVLAACSTTRRIPGGELLYTGTKKIALVGDSIHFAPGVESAIKSAVDVRPNNYWAWLNMRSPFPVGLWVYNNWNDSAGGLKGWLYDKLVEEPVLVSDVRPQVRTHMIEQILDNNGFFSGTATYELVQGKNPRKASIRYSVNPGPEYPVDTIMLLPEKGFLM